MIRCITYSFLLVLVLACTGCTGLRYISSTDPLLIGNELTYATKEEGQKKLTPGVKELLKPEPNNKFLWMRPSLARYNMLSDSAKTKKFWKGKIMAPVLLSGASTDLLTRTIQNRVFHSGYFDNTVAVDTIRIGRRKVKLNYTITLQEPYRIESVTFPSPQIDLTQKINDIKDESLLHKGDIYTLEAVKSERGRIDRQLKENGYIYFSPDFIF